jgi:peptidyl-tRNA hydrolase, PTH1 family
MKLIVGLGNPGEKYQNNRHNVGFQFVDYIIETLQIPISKSQIPKNFQILNSKFQKKYNSEFCILNSKLVLLKPLTFMNHSGLAVKQLTTTYHLHPTDLIVIHDDLDIPLGKFKIQVGVGPKLHNGLESIENHLHSKDFLRVRIGVDTRPSNDPTRYQPAPGIAKHQKVSGEAGYRMVPGEDYVLHDFTPDQKQILQTDIFPKIFSHLKSSFV